MFQASSSNPALGAFQTQRWDELMTSRQAKVMTMTGTVIATSVLLAICVVSALATWSMVVQPAVAAGSLGSVYPWLLGSIIGGLVLGLVCTFAPKACPIVGPVYAGVEGVALATISAMIMQRFLGKMDPMLMFQAVTVTFGIFSGMLVAYGAGWVKAGGIVMKMFIAASIGVALYFFAMLLGRFFFPGTIPNLWASASPMGIAFSGLLVAMASYSLVIDFEVVKRGVETRAPKYMEWYAGVGLLVSLVWLYIEVLRLLAKLRRD